MIVPFIHFIVAFDGKPQIYALLLLVIQISLGVTTGYFLTVLFDEVSGVFSSIPTLKPLDSLPYIDDLPQEDGNQEKIKTLLHDVGADSAEAEALLKAKGIKNREKMMRELKLRLYTMPLTDDRLEYIRKFINKQPKDTRVSRECVEATIALFPPSAVEAMCEVYEMFRPWLVNEYGNDEEQDSSKNESTVPSSNITESTVDPGSRSARSVRSKTSRSKSVKSAIFSIAEAPTVTPSNTASNRPTSVNSSKTGNTRIRTKKAA